jgi:hypothetical protein
MITGLQSTFALVCTSSCLLILLGCGGKPDFGAQEVRSIEIQSSAGSRTASSKQIEEFIAAFQRARVLRDDIGTTHEVRADVVFTSGEKLVIWGGEASFQTIAFRGRQFNLQGEELRAFLLRVGSQKIEPQGQ